MKANGLERIGQALTGKRGRWIVLLLWIAVTAAANVLLPSSDAGKNDAAANLPDDLPSVQAELLLEREFSSGAGVPALVVWYREGGLQEKELSAIQAVAGSLGKEPLPHQTSLVPLDRMPAEALQSLLSEDRTTLVQAVFFDKTVTAEQWKESLDELQHRVGEVTGEEPFDRALDEGDGLTARITGPVGIATDATELFSQGDLQLLMATVVLVVAFLLLIYRSPILVFVPLIAVGFAYGLTGPLLGFMADAGWIEYDSQALSIMTVLLFGAGTDYCLFLIARFRSLLTETSSRSGALLAALKESSGAIAMSGLTVVISLLVLLLAEYGALHRFAIPFSLSILIMMAASLTLVPALLGLFGRASFWPFVPRTPEMARERAARRGKPAPKQREAHPIGRRIGNAIVRRPWPIVVVTVVILGVLAVYSAQIKFTTDTLSSFPADMPSREGFTLIEEHVAAGELAPLQVMVRAGDGGDEVKEALDNLPFVAKVGEPEAGRQNPDIVSYQVELSMNPYSTAAVDSMPELRGAVERALSDAGVENAAGSVWIAGQTAEQYDTRVTTSRDAKVIIPVIIAMIALLLLVYLRSLVAMLYLMATVLLSYFSALGLGWFVIQEWLGADAMQALIPLYAFVFLVALGEDYNIFMVSSIWQQSKRMPLNDAVHAGVVRTGSVITSAGLILAATFAVLGSMPIQVLVQFGIVTSLGVLLDTFIVRPFLVPAITVILGKWSFWPGKPGYAEAAVRENSPSMRR